MFDGKQKRDLEGMEENMRTGRLIGTLTHEFLLSTQKVN